MIAESTPAHAPFLRASNAAGADALDEAGAAAQHEAAVDARRA